MFVGEVVRQILLECDDEIRSERNLVVVLEIIEGIGRKGMIPTDLRTDKRRVQPFGLSFGERLDVCAPGELAISGL